MALDPMDHLFLRRLHHTYDHGLPGDIPFYPQAQDCEGKGVVSVYAYAPFVSTPTLRKHCPSAPNPNAIHGANRCACLLVRGL